MKKGFIHLSFFFFKWKKKGVHPYIRTDIIFMDFSNAKGESKLIIQSWVGGVGTGLSLQNA